MIEQQYVGGAIRAVMMGVHAYFNIWCEARAGWAVFINRRTAVAKISSLPEASEQQLRAFDDVCAICYQVKLKMLLFIFFMPFLNYLFFVQDMTSAKITRCKHYFHGVCLRKWLYVQDRCPLCHEIIMNHEPMQQVDPTNNDRNAAPAPAAAAAAAAAVPPVAIPVLNAAGGGGGALLQNAADV